MKQILLKDKFPVLSLEITKSETKYANTDEIIAYLKEKIESHKVARFIAIFDHYGHVKALENGVIDESILDSKNILFCLSAAIPNTQIAAVRPRSIAVNELKDKFVINFLEAPVDDATNTMKDWVISIQKG